MKLKSTLGAGILRFAALALVTGPLAAQTPTQHSQSCPPQPTIFRSVAQGVVSGSNLSNGVVLLGVQPYGNLINGEVGITFIPTGGESLAPGCPCEGWGVGDAITGAYGQAGDVFGYTNLVLDSFTTTPTTAVSVVRMLQGGEIPMLKITHDYHPSVSPNLFECTVTIKNISLNTVDLRYRRPMDWDIPPTPFSELVTVQTGGASAVLFSSDDGFADGNPFAGPSWIDFTGEAVDSGPDDHGALFDLGFGPLAAGATKVFHIYYGAASNYTNAMAALNAVGASQVYSLGKPNPGGGGGGLTAGTVVPDAGVPNTFIFGFTGVGEGLSFMDDTGRTRFCVSPQTGDFTWNILSGPGAGTSYTGNAIVKDIFLGGYSLMQVNNKFGAPFTLNFSYNKTLNSASGYYKPTSTAASYLADKLTTDDPAGCFSPTSR